MENTIYFVFFTENVIIMIAVGILLAFTKKNFLPKQGEVETIFPSMQLEKSENLL